jgi:host factor-I protein
MREKGRGFCAWENFTRRRRGVSNEKQMKVQDGYLNFLRRERIPVAVHFFTGMQLRGVVRGFDTYTLVLELEGTNKQVLIFKHGVLYVDPMRPVGDVVGRLMAEAQQAEQARQAQQQSKQQQQQQKHPRQQTPAESQSKS